jgi:hypothetical protein
MRSSRESRRAVTRVARFAVVLPAFAVVLVALASGCSSIESYSVRAAEESCSSLSVCTVYGPNGESLPPQAGR